MPKGGVDYQVFTKYFPSSLKISIWSKFIPNPCFDTDGRQYKSSHILHQSEHFTLRDLLRVCMILVWKFSH